MCFVCIFGAVYACMHVQAPWCSWCTLVCDHTFAKGTRSVFPQTLTGISHVSMYVIMYRYYIYIFIHTHVLNTDLPGKKNQNILRYLDDLPDPLVGCVVASHSDPPWSRVPLQTARWPVLRSERLEAAGRTTSCGKVCDHVYWKCICISICICIKT